MPKEIYSNKGFEIRTVPGYKGPVDEALEIKTSGGEWYRIDFRELCYMRNELLKNEDRLYPPPKFKGHRMLEEMERYAFETDPETAYKLFVTSYREKKKKCS